MSAFESDLEHGPSHVPNGSNYLQERLRERRQRSPRPKRSRHTDIGPKTGLDDDIFLIEAAQTYGTRAFDSSPLAVSTRASDAGLPAAASRRRAPPGVRDMDAQLDQLSKQNFALKLELDHRREQTKKLLERIESMQEQFERAECLEMEHGELLKINSALIGELDKRAKAVEEAVDHICELEDRVAELEDRSHTRPSTAHADSGYAGTETHEQGLTSSPPKHSTPKTPYINIRQPSQPASAASAKLQGILGESASPKTRREPSFMTQKKPSTHALRSVYLESARQLHPVKSFQSLLSRQESRADETQSSDGIVLNSPRLSVLSESSFPSIYSPKKQSSPDRYPWEGSENGLTSMASAGGRAHLRQDSIKRVSQWISERDVANATPSKSNTLSAPLSENNMEQLPSVSTMAQDRASRRLGETGTPKTHDLLRSAPRFEPAQPRSEKGQSTKKQSGPTSMAGPMFGEPLLPPTPESASTRMLRTSRSSIADDRSLLDTTPAPVKGFAPLEPGVRSAPKQMRSSIELNSAYAQNAHSRNLTLGDRGAESSSDEDDDQFAHLDPIAKFGGDYDGFPDGTSIVTGTPSRFVKHRRPVPPELDYDGYGSVMMPPRSPERTRRTSVNASNSPPSRARLPRTETSPSMFSSLSRMMSPSGKSSVETVLSPRSAHSGSSGNRTVVLSEEHHSNRPVSPEATRNTLRPTPVSPRQSRTLSQRTHNLFRRFSNSNGSDRAEKSPILPTLTSTPSSAYVNTIPIEVRRPRTSHGHDGTPKPSASATPARPPSSRDTRRPSLQARTKTEPPMLSPKPAEQPSTEGTQVEKEKKYLLRRNNSVKANIEPAVDPQEAAGGNDRNVSSKRRGSIRDAVATARRPWR